MQRIVQDTFPALVSIAPATFSGSFQAAPPTPGTRQLNTVRVVLTESTVLIAQDTATGPQILFQEPYDPASHVRNPKRSEDSTVTTLSGRRLAFRKDNNCGCGSRLRSWNPLRAAEDTQ